jgi:hypothetical protein
MSKETRTRIEQVTRLAEETVRKLNALTSEHKAWMDSQIHT